MPLLNCASANYRVHKNATNYQDDLTPITLTTGETLSLIDISYGFPGWWGYLPGAFSADNNVAKIHNMKHEVVIEAIAPGTTWGIYGNAFTYQVFDSSEDVPRYAFEIIVAPAKDNHAAP